MYAMTMVFLTEEPSTLLSCVHVALCIRHADAQMKHCLLAGTNAYLNLLRQNKADTLYNCTGSCDVHR